LKDIMFVDQYGYLYIYARYDFLARIAESISKVYGEVVVLLHSELSECLAAMRLNPKNATEVQDQKDKIGEELADYFIRLADYCGKKEIDLEKAIAEKMKRNQSRPRLHNKKF